jgi:hypothetical protein
MAVAHAHRAHPADELFGRGRHVGQRRAVVRHLVDVEEARAGDVAGSIFGLCVAPHLRQIPRRIEDAQIRILQMGLKPGGRDKRARIVLGHRLSPHGRPCPLSPA